MGASIMSMLQSKYKAARSLTNALGENLSAEDQMVQSSSETDSMKWHQALPTWFFENFVLCPYLIDYKVYREELRQFFKSYYQSLGSGSSNEQLQRSFSRPSLQEVLGFRVHVDQEMDRLFAHQINDEVACRISQGLHHEQRHQELALSDIKHVFFSNPLRPTYRQPPLPREPAQSVSQFQWLNIEGGIAEIGRSYMSDEPLTFSMGNETPRHRVFLEPFQIASRKVTCREYLEFISDDGYLRQEFWLPDGWAAAQTARWVAPLYWERDLSDSVGWSVFTLRGCHPVSDLFETPVCHISFFEADAFARWRRSRLPTESEWELVASTEHQYGNLLDTGRLHPSRATGIGLEQVFGDCWEWTSSPYTNYPGNRAVPGELGEFNEKFMPSQMVLRGGSCITAPDLVRATYRNCLNPATRRHFTGVRLAH